MITMRSVCVATAILTTGVMSGGFNDVPLGEDTFLDGKRGFWKKTENSTCLVEPTPMCKYKSWTLCEFEGTSWCAFEDFKCAKDKVGCIDEDGKDVDGFIEMECEEPDNKCGDSFCGTAPLNDDCQCVTDACFNVTFVPASGSHASSIVGAAIAGVVIAGLMVTL